MALLQLEEEQVRTWTRAQKDEWWFRNVYRGDMPQLTIRSAMTVKGFNRRGQPVKIKASGWLARIFQHEIDHLDGVLFVDRTERVWKVEEKTGQVLPAD